MVETGEGLLTELKSTLLSTLYTLVGASLLFGYLLPQILTTDKTKLGEHTLSKSLVSPSQKPS